MREKRATISRGCEKPPFHRVRWCLAFTLVLMVLTGVHGVCDTAGVADPGGISVICNKQLLSEVPAFTNLAITAIHLGDNLIGTVNEQFEGLQSLKNALTTG